MRAKHIVIAVAAIGLFAVLLVASPFRSRPAQPATQPPPAAAAERPLGSVPSLGEARLVALVWVSSTGELLRMGGIERGLRLERLVVPSARAAMAASFETGASQLAGRLPIPPSELLLVETPVTSTARSDGAAAVVEVWSVIVFGAEPLGAPRSVWRTTTVRLEAVDGTWMVASFEVRLGPTPVAGDGLPATWPEFAAVAGWPSASSSGVGS